MKPLWGKLAALASLALLLDGCNCALTPDPQGHPCDVGNVCPGGYACVAGLCQRTGGTGGGAGGGAGGGSALCDGVVCNMPPAALCLSSSTLRTFAGSCNGATGQCDYSPTDTPCAQGCLNGACVGDPCAGMSCNAPPSPTCMNDSVVTSALPGTCQDGACRYAQTTTPCPGGCAGGACVPVGASFQQTLPRVRHQITAIDQEPNSAGADVVVVGPAGALSRWNGAQWSTVNTGQNGNLSAVWFYGANLAYLVGERGLFRLTGTPGTVAPVNTFPGANNSRLIDVHGVSDSNFAVVDSIGTVYRWSGVVPSWTTRTNTGSAPYAMAGVYMSVADPLMGTARVRYYGSCQGATGGSVVGCVVYQGATGNWFDDKDSTVRGFRSMGPSLDGPTANFAWAGLDGGKVRRHDGDNVSTFDSTNVPTLPSMGAVVAMSAAGPTASRATFLLTAPTADAVGHLFRASGTAASPTVESLLDTVYGFQAMSKTETSGVIVVDMDVSFNTSTITRRGPVANEVLDLGAETWVAGHGTSNGAVLLNFYGDVAVITQGQATFDLRRTRYDLVATDIAAGSTFALVATDDRAWRLPLAQGSTFTEITPSPAPAGLNAVCRATDTEWYFAGAGGQLFGSDGTTLTPQTSPTTQPLHDVDCPQAGQAVACGEGGTVVVRQNGQWTLLNGAPQGRLTSCRWVSGALYVAGPNTFARYAAGTWTTLPALSTMEGLVVRAQNDVYTASGRNVHRFNGSSWASVATATQALTTGFTASGRVTFAGAGGAVMEGQ